MPPQSGINEIPPRLIASAEECRPAVGGGVSTLCVPSDDGFPNNADCPVLVYWAAFAGEPQRLALQMEARFGAHGWSRGVCGALSDSHHYHSTAHEVFGCCRGRASIQLGGPRGISLDVAVGDVLALPAGVTHRALRASLDFRIVSSFAGGSKVDSLTGRAREKAQAEQNIRLVPRPLADPISGRGGPLVRSWRVEV